MKGTFLLIQIQGNTVWNKIIQTENNNQANYFPFFLSISTVKRFSLLQGLLHQFSMCIHENT